ncbi:288_t:CDS:2, partial [Entrophospora sp. SA101]
EFCYYGTDLSEEQVYNACIQATVDIEKESCYCQKHFFNQQEKMGKMETTVTLLYNGMFTWDIYICYNEVWYTEFISQQISL